MTKPQVTRARLAGDEHQVVSVEGGHGGYRRTPCGGCPWRVDQVGEFPPEAFEHSAETATDLAGQMFGCHESGTDRPVTCAGFLLRGADHNMAVRMAAAAGRIDLGAVSDGGHALHAGYRTMAIENGVADDSPALRNVRDSWDEEDALRAQGGRWDS